ncbi:MAG: hypothetical protein LBS94_05630 [Prevotellaceae bacterium]|jgi:hypothetical protein|nr:hypothetical protein [Prevotellaceae bacterium]
MQSVYTEITLENSADVTNACDGLIQEHEVHRMRVNAIADTSVWNLVINEATRAQLGLRINRTCEVEVAKGVTEKGGITEPVSVRWRNRYTACDALVLPNERDVLLGNLPLFGMDLMVDPHSKEVVGAHGDKPRYVVK